MIQQNKIKLCKQIYFLLNESFYVIKFVFQLSHKITNDVIFQ